MKTLLFVVLLLVLLTALTGCIREPGTCNYDGICTEDETDDCVDCKDVVGRDVDVNTPPENPVNSP